MSVALQTAGVLLHGMIVHAPPVFGVLALACFAVDAQHKGRDTLAYWLFGAAVMAGLVISTWWGAESWIAEHAYIGTGAS